MALDFPEEKLAAAASRLEAAALILGLLEEEELRLLDDLETVRHTIDDCEARAEELKQYAERVHKRRNPRGSPA